MYGDFCQLPPILDPGGTLFGDQPTKSEMAALGHSAYLALQDRVFALTEPMRQGRKSVLLGHLMDARNGTKSVLWKSLG
jgi:hypothetical protein